MYYNSNQSVMKYNFTILLHSIMLLVTLDSSVLVISQTTNNTQNCSAITNLLYSRSAVFKSDTTPKDVEIFKYYCTADLVLTVENETLVRKFYLLLGKYVAIQPILNMIRYMLLYFNNSIFLQLLN